jgi:hypothetical protein
VLMFSRNLGTAILALGLLVLWQFPTVWYAGKAGGTSYQWFGLNEAIPGWEFSEIPVGDAAEAILVADRMDNGAYSQGDGPIVRVFSAKRFEEKENAVGLFSHTPDRCWTNTGMVIEHEEPYFRNVDIHEINMVLERRVFSMGSQRELVYFGALVGGAALPYRMDQYLGSGRRREKGVLGDGRGAIDRLLNTRVWGWAFESFVKRARLAGPQQLIRISTPIADSVEVADTRLLNFFKKWLSVVSYEDERRRFESEREAADE